MSQEALRKLPGRQQLPKHLLRQNFPSKGKFWVNLRDNFPLKIAFPFPPNGQFSHETKGLRKKEFLWLEGKFMTFPREGKFTSSHFFVPQKMLWAAMLAGDLRQREAVSHPQGQPCHLAQMAMSASCCPELAYSSYLSMGICGTTPRLGADGSSPELCIQFRRGQTCNN